MNSAAVPSPSVRIDQAWFREVLGWYPTGVSVITAAAPGSPPVGMVVGTFTSVSLDPPLVGFLPAKGSTTWPRIATARHFCVNVLGSDQEEVCRTIGSKDPNKFDRLSWRPSGSGAPILDGAVAWIDCDLESVSPAGDHFFVLGAVRQLAVEARTLPLLFFQGGYGAFSPRSMASPDGAMSAELRRVDVARPLMEQLAATLSARANASVCVGEEVVMLATAGSVAPTAHSFVGRRLPAIGPLATVYMAFADDHRVETWLERAATDRERAELRRRREDVRARGYQIGVGDGLQHGEFERMWREGALYDASGDVTPDAARVIADLPYDPPGAGLDDVERLRSLHAPVFDEDGHTALALSLVLPASLPRTQEAAAQWVRELLAAADRVTEVTGGRRPTI